MILVILTMIGLFVYAFFRPLAGAEPEADGSSADNLITPLRKVTSEGILWQGNLHGATPYCPEHEVALLFKRNEDGRIERLADADPLSTNAFGGSYGTRAHGQLFCSEGDGHTMLPKQSGTYGEAKQRAEVLIRRDIRKEREAATAALRRRAF